MCVFIVVFTVVVVVVAMLCSARVPVLFLVVVVVTDDREHAGVELFPLPVPDPLPRDQPPRTLRNFKHQLRLRD